MVVFAFINPPRAIIDSLPTEWFLGRSENGWMHRELFFEYVANGVNSWLEKENIKKPVILFMDCHESHLTLDLSNFSSHNGAIFYALPPT
ncbi:hypothetical protein PR048_005279 [Dryococelus australis]|uniref:DDE-1 domain-containing protein n=1 Tax=Dryococelus australis TaxID=614101 RepID=A0ABQ9I7S2_9NEOP|nr:hypothetical protein PR048_005279 [Dryococelus australis]